MIKEMYRITADREKEAVGVVNVAGTLEQDKVVQPLFRTRAEIVYPKRSETVSVV